MDLLIKELEKEAEQLNLDKKQWRKVCRVSESKEGGCPHTEIS